MGLLNKIKSLALNLAGAYHKSSYVYMQNTIHGSLDNTLQYITKAFQLNAHIYSITSFLAGKVASVPFELYEIVDEKKLIKYKSLSNTLFSPKTQLLKTKALQQVNKDHPIIRMLNKNPNDYMTASEFKYGFTIYRLLTGNSFIRGFAPEAEPNKFVELHILPSHLTVPLGGTAYSKVTEYKMAWDPEKIPAENVSHSRYFNPNFEWPSNPHILGQAPLMAAAKTILRSNSGMDASIKTLQNGGVSGILYKDGGSDLSDPQRDLLQEHIDKKTSSGNYKQILAASAKMGWIKIGENPVELGLLDLDSADLRTLCNIFHVNSALFNDPENKTYNNISEARKAAITDAVIPELVALRDAINQWLVPGWEEADGKKYFVDFDASVFAELQANMKELAEWLSLSWWITPNQKLIQMDYEPLGPEYDVPFIPAGIAPLGSDMSAEEEAAYKKAFKMVGGIDYED